MIRQGVLTGIDHKTACKNYVKAAVKGVVKVMSKMGISTIQSYCGAQIFEAVGLNQDFIDNTSPGPPSRVGGVGLDVIAEEVLVRHAARSPNASQRPYRSTSAASINGARTASIICSIRKRSTGCNGIRTSNYTVFKEYSDRSTIRRKNCARCAACSTSNKSKPMPHR